MATILYALIEQRPGHQNIGQPFYIGIGTAKRPFQHLRAARTAGGHYNVLMHACLWDHIATGVDPKVEILGTYESRNSAADAERQAIVRYGRIGRDTGGILCNIAHGGAGPDPDLLRDPEILARVAAASRARWADAGFKKQISDAMREMAADPQWIDRVSNATARAINQPETRARHLAALARINAARTHKERCESAKKKSPEAMARSVAALAKTWHDPAIQAKRIPKYREYLKADWADPERRAKRTAALKGNKKTMTPAALEARRKNARKPRSKEAIEAQRAAAVRNWCSDEFRVERARSQAAAWEDPGKRANMLAGRSQGISKSWNDPAVRARRIAGIKAAALKRAETKRGHNDTVSCS